MDMARLELPAERQVFSGRLGEVVHQTQPDGRVFELFRRPPGVRMIFIDGDRVLLTEEYRSEVNGIDLRLPGGKVFDDLETFTQARRSSADLTDAALRAARREAHEEVGLTVSGVELVTIARAGATVEWDLYYYVVREFTEASDGPQPEEGEQITTRWFHAAEVLDAVRAGRMSEWRSVGVLLGLVMPREFPYLFAA
ncbi:NUDIX domain-containing protein [Micromonospora sp. AMSO12t]|uniref:NUDIX hydrolase n=1 Tax=Micromonospora sp. AMSO12t TaxID=2650410 RepID=UPI00124B4A66|nr:NUDIX domain-containing protein [Micromonospora sp. AMSO12t]KAB1159031.1 NUDIX domain-containing protein [Micromonospora sp. AMSO12t]